MSGWTGAQGRAPRAPRPLSLRLRDWRSSAVLVPVAAAALTVAAHLAFGANDDVLALGFGLATAALLALAVTAFPWAREPFAAPGRWLQAAYGLFALVVVVGLLQFLPLGPVHPAWGAVGARGAVTLDKAATAVTLVKLLAVGCAFLLGQAIGASGERGDRFFRVLLVLLAAFAAWAFISFLADPNGLFGHRRVSEARRLAAAFGSPNNAATLFGAGALLATGGLAGVIGRFGGWRGAVGQVEAFLPAAAPALVCLLFCVVDLLLSASRAGIAATGLCLFVLVLWEALGPGRGGPAGRGALTAAAAGVAVLAWLALSREQVIDRFASASDDFEARRQIFEAHWRAVTASPWLGYGLGVFDDMNRMLLDPGNAGSLWKPRAAHNVYLQWLEAAGVVGAVPMFAAVGCAVVAITAGIGRRRRTAGWMRAVVCVSLLIAVHGFTDYALETPSIALFWALLLGVGAGLGDGARR